MENLLEKGAFFVPSFLPYITVSVDPRAKSCLIYSKAGNRSRGISYSRSIFIACSFVKWWRNPVLRTYVLPYTWVTDWMSSVALRMYWRDEMRRKNNKDHSHHAQTIFYLTNQAFIFIVFRRGWGFFLSLLLWCHLGRPQKERQWYCTTRPILPVDRWGKESFKQMSKRVGSSFLLLL